MELIEKRMNGVVVLTLVGRMDAVNTPEFNAWFDNRLDSGERNFVVDCSGLIYLSSAGLRGFLTSAREIAARTGRLAVSGLFGGAREVFRVSGFMSAFETHPTVESACGALAAGR